MVDTTSDILLVFVMLLVSTVTIELVVVFVVLVVLVVITMTTFIVVKCNSHRCVRCGCGGDVTHRCSAWYYCVHVICIGGTTGGTGR